MIQDQKDIFGTSKVACFVNRKSIRSILVRFQLLTDFLLLFGCQARPKFKLFWMKICRKVRLCIDFTRRVDWRRRWRSNERSSKTIAVLLNAILRWLASWTVQTFISSRPSSFVWARAFWIRAFDSKSSIQRCLLFKGHPRSNKIFSFSFTIPAYLVYLLFTTFSFGAEMKRAWLLDHDVYEFNTVLYGSLRHANNRQLMQKL